MAFDPATDEPGSANALRIVQTYDELVEQGYEEAAQSLREASPLQRQQRLHIRLRKEHLVETDGREIIKDRDFDRSLGSTPEERKQDVESFLERRNEKKKQMKDALAAKKERISKRLE